MTTKRGKRKTGMSKRLRQQKACMLSEQDHKQQLTNMSDKDLQTYINSFKQMKGYSGVPHFKKWLEDAINELQSRKK
jgi:hypothetical protein